MKICLLVGRNNTQILFRNILAPEKKNCAQFSLRNDSDLEMVSYQNRTHSWCYFLIFYPSIDHQSNVYKANRPGVARLSGATAEATANNNLKKTANNVNFNVNVNGSSGVFIKENAKSKR